MARTVSINVLCAVLLTACAAHIAPCPQGAQPAVQDLLYFGQATPTGQVSESDWGEFIDSTLTKHFPAGFTVWQANGQWRDAHNDIIHEPSYVVSVVHPDTPTAEQALNDVVSQYKTRFQQEAVLRVRSAACMSL